MFTRFGFGFSQPHSSVTSIPSEPIVALMWVDAVYTGFVGTVTLTSGSVLTFSSAHGFLDGEAAEYTLPVAGSVANAIVSHTELTITVDFFHEEDTPPVVADLTTTRVTSYGPYSATFAEAPRGALESIQFFPSTEMASALPSMSTFTLLIAITLSPTDTFEFAGLTYHDGITVPEAVPTNAVDVETVVIVATGTKIWINGGAHFPVTAFNLLPATLGPGDAKVNELYIYDRELSFAELNELAILNLSTTSKGPCT